MKIHKRTYGKRDALPLRTTNISPTLTTRLMRSYIFSTRQPFPIPSSAKVGFHSVGSIGKPFHCPVCEKTIIRQFKNDVVLDHFHLNGEIRGWICRQCNSNIGMMDEDVSI